VVTATLAAVVVAASAVAPAITAPPARERVRAAAVLSTAGRLAAALDVLEPALEGDGADPLALDQAGWILQQEGRLDDARADYERALAGGMPPARQPQTRTRLARVLEALGDQAGAAREHDLAAASPHADAGTFEARGMFLLRAGDVAGARRDLETATRLDPRWPAPRETLRRLDGGLSPEASPR